MPLLVRNPLRETVILPVKGRAATIWQRAGDPSGEDLQAVPVEYADDPNFLDAVSRGVLSVENPDDLPDSARTMLEYRQNRGRTQAAPDGGDPTSVIVRRQDKDIVGVECIAPNKNGRRGQKCEAPVLIRAAALADTPPLCDAHQGFASQCIYNEAGSEGSGDRSGRWTLVGMGPVQRGQR